MKKELKNLEEEIVISILSELNIEDLSFDNVTKSVKHALSEKEEKPGFFSSILKDKLQKGLENRVENFVKKR